MDNLVLQLGRDSTLLNASGATNFTYQVQGYDFTDEEIEKINAISTKSKIIDRIASIRSKGGKLVFAHVDNAVFDRNLAMLDCCLDKVIAQLLIEQFNTGLRMFHELAKALAETNPLAFASEDAEGMYIYKLKHLLTSAALGMMPSKKWNGRYDTNCCVIEYEGSTITFRNKNQFEDLLFNNAYIHLDQDINNVAVLFRKENGKVYFKLNLQIRLK